MKKYYISNDNRVLDLKVSLSHFGCNIPNKSGLRLAVEGE